MSENIYIPIKDYASKKGVTVKTIYNHIESGKINPNRIKKILNRTLIKL